MARCGTRATRPNGDNPDSCIFNIWSLKRYMPGGEPELQRRVYKYDREPKTLGLIVDVLATSGAESSGSPPGM